MVASHLTRKLEFSAQGGLLCVKKTGWPMRAGHAMVGHEPIVQVCVRCPSGGCFPGAGRGLRLAPLVPWFGILITDIRNYLQVGDGIKECGRFCNFPQHNPEAMRPTNKFQMHMKGAQKCDVELLTDQLVESFGCHLNGNVFEISPLVPCL